MGPRGERVLLDLRCPRRGVSCFSDNPEWRGSWVVALEGIQALKRSTEAPGAGHRGGAEAVRVTPRPGAEAAKVRPRLGAGAEAPEVMLTLPRWRGSLVRVQSLMHKGPGEVAGGFRGGARTGGPVPGAQGARRGGRGLPGWGARGRSGT